MRTSYNTFLTPEKLSSSINNNLTNISSATHSSINSIKKHTSYFYTPRSASTKTSANMHDQASMKNSFSNTYKFQQTFQTVTTNTNTTNYQNQNTNTSTTLMNQDFVGNKLRYISASSLLSPKLASTAANEPNYKTNNKNFFNSFSSMNSLCNQNTPAHTKIRAFLQDYKTIKSYEINSGTAIKNNVISNINSIYNKTFYTFSANKNNERQTKKISCSISKTSNELKKNQHKLENKKLFTFSDNKYKHFDYNMNDSVFGRCYRITNRPCVNSPINSMEKVDCDTKFYMKFSPTKNYVSKGIDFNNLLKNGGFGPRKKIQEKFWKAMIEDKKKNKKEYNKFMHAMSHLIVKNIKEGCDKEFSYENQKNIVNKNNSINNIKTII